MTRMRPRLTLAQFIALGFATSALVLLVLPAVFDVASRRTILLASEQLMRQSSRRVAERVEGHLGDAERLLASLESAARLGVLTAETGEPALVGALGGHPQVTDVTFTYGRAIGVYEADEAPHEAGELRLAPGESGQVSVTRVSTDDVGGLVVRRILPSADGWRALETRIADDGTRMPAGDGPVAARDPTTHPTFTTPSRPAFRGRALWSDLAFFEADAGLPEAERRRVVSVQKALWTKTGAFVGVVRIALLSDRIDELVRITVDESAAERDDHVVFLCDGSGRLISRLSSSDRFALLDRRGAADDENGDVRAVPAALSAPVAAALAAAPSLYDVESREPMVTRLDVDGVSYLVSVAALLGDRTQGWLVGIVVPESHYLGALDASRRRAFAIALALVLAAAAGSAFMVRAMRRDLRHLIGQTTRLRRFDFRPSTEGIGAFRDIQDASLSLEQAKTALRALGKYVPLELVRALYDARREPALGADLQDVTLLFSDVAAFTSVAETLDPDTLATALGAYLEALTRAVHASGGIIDKYTGDGVMALWNTPRPTDRHPALACEAALAGVEATRALFASPAWQGRAPWRTRFGIHRAWVNVGHFGAPDRLSFTAMGDGVNLASRLEGLGKQYGVAIIVSATVEREARDLYWFRRLDRVAVKGKHEPVEIYELLARRVPGEPPPALIATYEAALDAYLARSFGQALDLLRALADDPPSRVLGARCRAFLAQPPADDWNGVHVAAEK